MLTLTGQEGFFVSLHMEKAFNRVAWDYMDAVLRAIGLGSHVLGLILFLYTNPSARIRISNTLPSAFPNRNGIRQGCPLSPILFILTLKPFFHSLRHNPNIQEICPASRQHKLAYFADDIVLVT